MAANKSDEPGVLGNLPRSRPGQRSDKRGGGATPTATAKASPATRAKVTKAKTKARAKASRTPKPAAGKTPASRGTASAATTTSAAPAPAPHEPKRDIPPPDDGGTDPLTGAVKLAGKVATIPLKTAGAIIKRLPGR